MCDVKHLGGTVRYTVVKRLQLRTCINVQTRSVVGYYLKMRRK